MVYKIHLGFVLAVICVWFFFGLKTEAAEYDGSVLPPGHDAYYWWDEDTQTLSQIGPKVFNSKTTELVWRGTQKNIYQNGYVTTSLWVGGMTANKNYAVSINYFAYVTPEALGEWAGVFMEMPQVETQQGVFQHLPLRDVTSPGNYVFDFQPSGTGVNIILTSEFGGTYLGTSYSTNSSYKIRGSLGLELKSFWEITSPMRDIATKNDINNAVSSINNKLVEQGNKIDSTLNEQLEVEKEQNETTKNIFEKISDFFGSFFDNIISTVVHLIIPTEEELQAFLQEIQDWFSAKLGFIWTPFDLAIRLVHFFTDTAPAPGARSASDAIFIVPALNLNIQGTTYEIWPEFTTNMDEFGIFSFVRKVGDIILVIMVTKLAVSKWDEWIGGHDG